MILYINNIGYSYSHYRTDRRLTIDNIPTLLFFSSNYAFYANPFHELEVK